MAYIIISLLIFKDHVHKKFPFGNHKMEKNCIFLFLGRNINHNNEMTPFIEIPKSKMQKINKNKLFDRIAKSSNL
jgi:hypothetical protein